jgi:hypothetical protein
MSVADAVSFWGAAIGVSSRKISSGRFDLGDLAEFHVSTSGKLSRASSIESSDIRFASAFRPSGFDFVLVGKNLLRCGRSLELSGTIS